MCEERHDKFPRKKAALTLEFCLGYFHRKSAEMKIHCSWIAVYISAAIISAVAEPSGEVAKDHASGHRSVSEAPLFPVVTSPEGESYFPEGNESYYTRYYRAARLPSMLGKREPKGQVRFRLAILPSFTKPLFLSYTRGSNGAFVEITRLGLQMENSRLELDGIELTGRVAISPRMATALESDAIDPRVRSPLLALTTDQKMLVEPLDGCTWILEVSTSEGYTMEAVNSPEWLGNLDPEIIRKHKLPKVDVKHFIEFCDTILKLTDMKLPENGAPQ